MNEETPAANEEQVMQEMAAPEQIDLSAINKIRQTKVMAWITADGIHTDPITGKIHLLGIFTTIYASAFPAQHGSMVWFIQVTNVPQGTHTMTIEGGIGEPYVKLLDRNFISIALNHRVSIPVEIRGITFTQPGHFGIRVRIDNVPVWETVLPVVEPPAIVADLEEEPVKVETKNEKGETVMVEKTEDRRIVRIVRKSLTRQADIARARTAAGESYVFTG